MPARLARTTWTFGINSGAERAQTTCHWLSPTGEPLEDLRDEIQPLDDDLWSVIRSNFASTVEMLALRLDEIDVNDGHVITGLDIGVPSTPTGGSIDKQLPAECSPVLTIRTPFTGGSYRGRMFLPPLTVGDIDGVGNLATTSKTDLVDAFADFFSSVDAGTSDWRMGVYSRALTAFTPASAVDMGSVMDVMRSRRRSLVENRYQVAL